MFSDVDELDALDAEDTSAGTVSAVGGRHFELHSWIIRTNSPRCAGHRTACVPLSWPAYHKRRQSARLLRESGIDGRWMIISAHQRGEGGGNATAKQCGTTTLIVQPRASSKVPLVRIQLSLRIYTTLSETLLPLLISRKSHTYFLRLDGCHDLMAMIGKERTTRSI